MESAYEQSFAESCTKREQLRAQLESNVRSFFCVLRANFWKAKVKEMAKNQRQTDYVPKAAYTQTAYRSNQAAMCSS